MVTSVTDHTDRKTLNLAVLISGNGSNLQAIIDSCQKDTFPANASLVISNKPSAYGLERAKKAGIETVVISNKDYPTRDAFDQEIMRILQQYSIDLVCLAGFMRIVTPGFVKQWHNKMINIHPSLLPSFKGMNAIEQAYEAGVKFAGCTVHYVRDDVDSGPIIVQAITDIKSNETLSEIEDKIHVLEHQSYPLAIELIAKGCVSFVDQDSITIKDDPTIVTPSNVNY